MSKGFLSPWVTGGRAQRKDLPQRNQESFHINKDVGQRESKKIKKKKKSTLKNEYYISKLDARKYEAK